MFSLEQTIAPPVKAPLLKPIDSSFDFLHFLRTRWGSDSPHAPHKNSIGATYITSAPYRQQVLSLEAY
jgi:hypothetical protein